MKKIIALLLVLVMVLGLFAACGNTDKPEETKGTEGGNETPDTPDEGGSEEIPTITWYTVGSGMPAHWESWTKQVNDYLDSKNVGVHLNYQIVDWGAWGDRRSVIVQTGEDWDLILCQGSEIVNDVAMNALAPIEDLMDTVPGLTDLIAQPYFDACTINGHLYGIPAYKDCSMTNYFVWHKATIEACYPEYENIHTFAEAYDALKASKEMFPEQDAMKLGSGGLPMIAGQKYDAAGVGDVGIGINYFNGTEFVPVWEQADVKADLEVVSKFYKEGLINSDAAILDTVEGIYTVSMAQGWPDAANTSWKREGEEVVVSQYEKTVVSTETVRGSVTAFNANSKHVAAALKFIEFVNTDTYMRDLLWYGQEGLDWNYIEENGVKKIERVEGHGWTAAAYTQGTFFTATPEVGSNGYAEIQVLNDQAQASPAMGFTFDATEWVDTIAALAAIKSQYNALIVTGTDVSVVDTMMAEMRANGFDDLLAAVNEQFKAWKDAQ